ncbi:MAG: VTT domain-containing protein, partial [Christensenellaceae bacterium]|nr:VTT domain-containing protein [Christensenellaceae bacterium]
MDKQQTKHRLLIALGVLAVLALIVLLAFSGDNIEIIRTVFTGNFSNEELRDLLMGLGWRGHIATGALAMLQVVCTFLPAEPVQVLAGFTFGFPVGLLCCMAGVAVGNIMIYMMQKTFGDKLRRYFVKKMNLDLEKIARSSKATLIIFILYFLPAIPYGMICFLASSMGMSFRRYTTVTLLGALPSVCIGVGLGHITLATNGVVTLCIFGVLVLALVVVFLKKDVLFAKLNDYADSQKMSLKNKARRPSGFIMAVVFAAIKVMFFFCGVRVKPVNKVDAPEKPSIILCNHGSFIDFIFAGLLLRRFKPNIIAARLYFYNTFLGWLLRRVGAFPKSMFAPDIENVKNCLTVLKEKNILLMMPEARLSTAGRFEDIQETTYSFIKRSGVAVYTIKLGGDYLANPKWGKGFRRGSLVEGELDLLYNAEQVK